MTKIMVDLTNKYNLTDYTSYPTIYILISQMNRDTMLKSILVAQGIFYIGNLPPTRKILKLLNVSFCNKCEYFSQRQKKTIRNSVHYLFHCLFK